MKVDILILKRCCCCVPLRQRFMTWGYIKLGTQLLLILLTTLALVELSIRFSIYTRDILITEAFLLILVLDLCLNMIFLVSRQRKSLWLLHMSYIYNIVLLFFYTVFLTWVTTTDLMFLAQIAAYLPYDYGSFMPLILLRLLVGTFTIGIQAYIIFLIRSEANKLRNWSKHRYTNLKAAEAEVLMLNAYQTAPQKPITAETLNAEI